ncbi:hypothetical protein [Amycolatopsis sp. NPDC059021]|uniref:hypothetical protein n=1 Tax=Amycolatopsis sp. NPDC059021 TaxID=3346704 RepID=UPI00366F4E4A
MRSTGLRPPRSALLTALLAAVVTAAALAGVVVLRPHPDTDGGDGAAAAPSAGPPPTTSTCGAGPCHQLAAMTVGSTPVVLLDAAQGGAGRVRIGPEPGITIELTIAEMGVRLGKDSLRCIEGSTSACLVRGEANDAAGGSYGELIVNRGGTWEDSGKPYFADAGTLSLYDVSADGAPDVIVVRHECPGSTPGTPTCQASPVLAEVYDLAGTSMGCTWKVTSPSELRGWPDIRLTRADLHACPS